MFKSFNEFLTFFTLIAFILFVIRMSLSFVFTINKDSFSLKDQIKYFYNNEDE